MMKKRMIKKYLFLALVAVVALGLVALPFMLDRMRSEAGDGASILSANVERRDLSRTVSGAGTLEAKEALELTVPEGVVITGYTVSDGDLVKAGDPVAEVDPVSVYKTAADLAEKLSDVTEELSALQNAEAPSITVASQVNGTITAVYAQVGDDVRQIMEQHGALCEISLDDGTVLSVTATSGTVFAVSAQEGRSIYSGNGLFILSDVDGTGGYGALVLKRQKIEEQMAQLFQMLRDGYAAAPGDGMITDTDKSLVKAISALGGTARVTLLGYTKLSDPGQDPPAPSRTEYQSGTLSSALDSAKQGSVSGVSGTLDFSAFPDAKKGDIVFLRKDTYTQPGADGNPEITAITYTVLLVSPGSQNTPGGGTSPGGGGTTPSGGGTTPSGGGMTPSGGGAFPGGGMPSGGIMPGADASSGAAAADEEDWTLSTTTLASVVPTDEVLVKITIDELDILTLHEGDAAQVTIDALPGRSFSGVVSGVNTGRSNSGGNSKYTAEVLIPLEKDMLAGMNASYLVTIETFRGVLCVPAAAVCDEAGGALIYTAVSSDGTLQEPVYVELGFSDGETVEILSGLSEGDTIWYSTYDTPEYSLPSAKRGGLSITYTGGKGGPPV